jgi:hypothetical protein
MRSLSGPQCSRVAAAVLATGAAVLFAALGVENGRALADTPTDTSVTAQPVATTSLTTTTEPTVADTDTDTTSETATETLTTTTDTSLSSSTTENTTTTTWSSSSTTETSPVLTETSSSPPPTTSAVTSHSPTGSATLEPAPPTETPQRLVATSRDVALASQSAPITPAVDPAPQGQLEQLRALLKPPTDPDNSLLQWQPDWVRYSRDGPVILNPFPTALQLVYLAAGTTRIVTIPPLGSLAPGLVQAGDNFSVLMADAADQLRPVAVGSFLPGDDRHLPSVSLPQVIELVKVIVTYAHEIFEPFVVQKIVDVGPDPSVGEHEHKVLLDGVTPAWGQWREGPEGKEFEIHKTQQLPGLDKPAEGPLPGRYPLQLASSTEDASALDGFLVIWVVAVVVGLCLSAIIVRIVGRGQPPAHRRHEGPHLPPWSVPVAPPRVLNVALADTHGSVLSKSAVLATDGWYQVRVDVSAAPEAQSLQHPTPQSASHPPPVLAAGFWLYVLIVSSDVDVVSQLHRLYLPKSGPSWVCRCDPQEHTCTPADRQPYVSVGMRTRSEPGQAHLRCIIYDRNNVVQSTRLDFMVGAGRGNGNNINGDIDFRLVLDVSDAHLLPARQLSVLTNETGSGTHTIAVNDGSRPIAVYLSESEAANVLASCRTKLTQIVLNKGGTGSNYDQQNRKPTDAFIQDLKALALLGSQLFSAVVPDRDDRVYLREQLRNRAKIQVTRVTKTAFPWALLYDIPREVAVPWTLCRLLREWDSAADELSAYPDGCPYQSEHGINVLCPYGFWGIRHLMEEPPSITRGVLRDTIRVYPPARAALVRSLALNPALTEQHFTDLRGCLSPPFDLLSCDSRALLRSAFADPTLPLVYFYCHGGRALVADTAMEIPSLQIGQDDQITPTDFAAWDEAGGWTSAHWADTAPLVFINGCETAKLTPEDILSFVQALAGMHAAGVIGTETTVDQTIAGEVALRFYQQFCGARASVGRALHRMRIDLLRKGNISGLVYTPYCSMDLALQFATAPHASLGSHTVPAMASQSDFATVGYGPAQS